MADFVAVIRRAVDGLSDNNAEMRSKVYEKARGAVRRQLESMNPRPSDELMKRQLDKLEAAIGDVESDHAEALPADEPAPEPVEELVYEEVLEPEPVAEEPAAEPEPDTQSVEAEPEHVDEPVVEHHAEEPSVEEPVAEPVVEPEPSVEEPVSHDEAVAAEAHIEPSWQAEATPVDDYVPSWHEPEPEITPEAGAETVEAAAPEPQVYPVHDVVLPEGEPVAEARMPAAEEQWDWDEAAAATVVAGSREPAALEPAALEPADPLAWDWPGEKASQPEDKQGQPAQKADWDDLDDLIGFGPKSEPTPVTTPVADTGLTAAAPSSASREPAPAPQRSFRAEPRKPRLNRGALVATAALVAIVGGAGAAYWVNRDAVNGWFDEKVTSVTGPSAETPQTNDTAEGGRGLPSNTAETTDTASGTAGTTEVASASQNSSGKFTQRLLTDGSEVDDGPAPALDGGVAEEGKSVAAQSTETAGAAVEDGLAGGQTPAAGTDGAAQTPTDTGAAATTTDTQAPADTGEQASAIGVGQKMFLYEERLGQTAPTAIEGTVAWSSAEESPGGDAKPEPVVRAQINVPSKGLTALVTFRRNADASLPASHLVELVFSLPENFEGGGIESVQRVAMKRTEQDRGDALIAVPAKITDDFHMIALNDFPEAIAKNTELLRTRSWIDIPITYRNGRRALLTLDKGAAGADAFDKVMKAWTTAGTQ